MASDNNHDFSDKSLIDCFAQCLTRAIWKGNWLFKRLYLMFVCVHLFDIFDRTDFVGLMSRCERSLTMCIF